MKYKASLHTHSIYSSLDGLQNLNQIANKAEEFGLKGVAITDHGNMSCAYKWSKICKDKNIKGIVGYEAYYVDGDMSIKEKGEKRYHMTLIASGKDGLLDLGRIASAASSKGFFYKPRVDYKTLKKWNKSKNIIALSGCLAGLIPQMVLAEEPEENIVSAIHMFQKVFGEDKFFLEIMPEQNEIPEIKKIGLRLTDISRKYGIPIVATNDSHYINKEDAVAHDLLIAINTKKQLSDPKRFKIEGTYHFKSPEEMEKEMSYCPESLITTGEIVDMIDDNYFPKTDPYMPTIKSKNDTGETIKKICSRRLEKYLNNINAHDETITMYKERFDMEYGVLKKYKLFDYFAVLKVIIDYAKKNDIYVGPGRGSAAGSLISFLLGITGADPLEHGLLFSRFLNEGRLATGSLPDIDVDFEASRRQEIYEFIREYFGISRTCNIITFGRLKPKSAIKDTGKALGIDYQIMNELTKNLSDDFTFEDIDLYPDAKKISEKYPKLFSLAEKVSGSIRQVGMHAAGLIICPKVLTDIIPVTTISNRTTGERVITSQYDMKDVESLGLIKIDVLGSSTQTQIHDIINLIKDNYNKDIDISKVNIHDTKVYEDIFCKMKTNSIFQVSSDTVKSALAQVQPKNIQDLTVLNAIVRPGAKEFIPIYAANKANPKQIKYIDDALKPILEETYGILIYQEQVMEICKTYAGFTEAQSDDIRRAIGKKIPELIDSYRNKFIQGAVLNNHNEEKAAEVYSLFVAFGEYGFNKSHSLCYSLVSYHTAWLKYYYPTEFYAGTLSLELVDENKKEEDSYIYIRQIQNEMRSLGISILPPDINKSYTRFSTEKNNVRYGLGALKGVGLTISNKICRVREDAEYIDFVNFIKRNSHDSPAKNVMVALIITGAFDSLNKNKFVLMQEFERIKKAVSSDENINEFEFLRKQDCDRNYGTTNEISSFKKSDILRKQKEVSGMYFSGHPLDSYKKYFEKMSFNSTHMLQAEEDDSVKILCRVSKVTKITTKKGDSMCFLDAEDFYGDLSITIFPRQFKEYRKSLIEGAVLSINGKINVYGEKKSIIANSLIKMI